MRDGFKELVDQVFNNNLESRKKLIYLFIDPDFVPVTECSPVKNTEFSPITDAECLPVTDADCLPATDTEFLPIAEYSSITEYSRIEEDELKLLEQKSTAFLPSATAYFIKGMCAIAKENYVLAVRYFDDAIQLNDADAMNARSLIYTHMDRPVNKRAAIDLLDRAIDLGNLDAMCYWAEAHQNTPASHEKVLNLLDKAIKQGHHGSMFLRARMHFRGDGGPRNCSEAGRLFRQSSLPRSFEMLKSVKNNYYLWLTLPSKQYQTLWYHCAAVEKEIAPCLKRYPHTLTDFLTDNLLTKEEKHSVLDTLKKDFFAKHASHFITLIINVFNDCQEKSVIVSSFSILQDHLPFTLKEEHFLPLIKKLLKEGSNREVYGLLLTEYQKYDPDYNPASTSESEEVLPKKTMSSRLCSSLSSCFFYQSHKGSSGEKNLKTNEDARVELLP